MAFVHCCWKPLSKKTVSLARVIERLTGFMSVKPKAGVSLAPPESRVFLSRTYGFILWGKPSNTGWFGNFHRRVNRIFTSTLALWYYWRWQIECFFKLLKSAGHHLESWQQESALAIAKRLLVASMACVTVWAIAADNSKEAAELRAFLVKLSGRQMRHKKEFTNPALLAGLWVFLSMLEIMEAYSQEEMDSLKATAQQFLGKVV